MTKIKAWHFIGNDRRLAHEPEIEVAPGYIYTSDQPIVFGQSGLHASRTVYDALQYAPGEYLCRVECWGEVIEQSDKLVARNRHLIAAQDVASELRLWACWCVRQQWHLLTDERSRRAVEVAEAFALGAATKADLADAYAAADAANAYSAAANAYAYSARAAAAIVANADARVAKVAVRAAYATAAYADAKKELAAELERRMLVLFGEAV